VWHVEGDIDSESAVSLYRWCEGLPVSDTPLECDLSDLEVVDSAGANAAIDVIRQLLQRSPHLFLRHAPHVLAHTLYRIGMLETGSDLTLLEPREEEPYG